MQIITKNLSYTFPSGKNVFHELSFSLGKGETAALAGDNGSGKSTLLDILTGRLRPDSGSVHITNRHLLVPQHFGQYNNHTLARVLQVQDKMDALRAIENGSVNPRHFETLAEDWAIHERVQAALAVWGLQELAPGTPFNTLSGGQKTRVFLAGITIHHPSLVLMDEPTNHLDTSGRKILYRLIREAKQDFLVVSHDRELLNLCNPVYELSSLGIKKYGGNYRFYEEQKQIEMEALEQQIQHSRKSISEARQKHRETMERKQKLNARAPKKARKQGLGKMAMNTARDRAEGSTKKLDEVHEQKINEEQERLFELKQSQRVLREIKLNLDDSSLHSGKILFKAKGLNFAWANSGPLWQKPLDFIIQSGERIQISGDNGSGKSTLIRLFNKELTPTAGKLGIASGQRFLLDQEYSFVHRDLTVLEQAEASNQIKKPDHELKTLLHRYLFEERKWDQKCGTLSGGEMMRLSLCCLTLQARQPDTIILDEPTNNLDLRNTKILTETLSGYRGTLLVISHDRHFIEELEIEREIAL